MTCGKPPPSQFPPPRPGEGLSQGTGGAGWGSRGEWALTVQAQGDVDGPFFHEALQVGDLGTLEDGLGGTVPHVDPAHGVLHVVEVHGRGLLGAGGGDVGHGGSAQERGQDVLGVGDEQHGRAIHGLWGEGGNKGIRYTSIPWL